MHKFCSSIFNFLNNMLLDGEVVEKIQPNLSGKQQANLD